MQYNTNFDPIKIRGTASLEKGIMVRSVQVNKVVLGDQNRGLIATARAANSGNNGAEATNTTNWLGVRDGACTKFRVRVDYSIRWADGALSQGSRTGSLTYGYYCRR